MNYSTTELILASASPRRAELLQQLGLSFRTVVADIDETPHTDEAVTEFVQRMATEKAIAVQDKLQAGPVILGADTIVTIDEHILGKPENKQHALEMYRLLSGRTHQVYSAITVLQGEQAWSSISKNDVSFRPLDTDEVEAYWATGEGADKAGGYAIQGLAAIFIEHLSGSFSSVMGLPLFETAKLLNLAGIKVLSANE